MMFERNRVDNARQIQGVEVELTMDDGRSLTGRVAVPMSRSFIEALNNDDKFVDFETFDGERTYLAKASLKSVRQLKVPAARALHSANNKAGSFDPHAILGVEQGADADTLRTAFLQKSKTYHPDRFAHVELPGEVCEYLQAAARRVNMAYELLQDALPAVTPVRSEPVWQSRQTASVA